MVNNIADDDLAMQGAKTSASMVLTYICQIFQCQHHLG